MRMPLARWPFARIVIHVCPDDRLTAFHLDRLLRGETGTEIVMEDRRTTSSYRRAAWHRALAARSAHRVSHFQRCRRPAAR